MYPERRTAHVNVSNRMFTVYKCAEQKCLSYRIYDRFMEKKLHLIKVIVSDLGKMGKEETCCDVEGRRCLALCAGVRLNEVELIPGTHSRL